MGSNPGMVLDVSDGGFFNDSVEDFVTNSVRTVTASGAADHADKTCRTLLPGWGYVLDRVV